MTGAALVLITLLAFAVRVYDLASLTLYGDYAYSVYAARQGWIAIAQERVLDGHPPLYYYLLHIWMLVFGQTELTIRLLSVAFGVLMVPLAFCLGTRQFGRRAGTLGSLLVAVSPALVHYSRLPRMYILLVLMALLSAYTLARALDLNRRRDWLAYSVATCLLLYTHYYGLALVTAEVAYVVWSSRPIGTRTAHLFQMIGAWRHEDRTLTLTLSQRERGLAAVPGEGGKLPLPRGEGRGEGNSERVTVPEAVPMRQFRRFFLAVGAACIAFSPWLLFAAVTAATTTARIISNAPWPEDIQGVLELLWIPFNVGEFLAIEPARVLALVALALWLVVLFVERRNLRQRWPELRFLVFAVAVPIAASLLLFLFVPYAVRPRFLIFCIPPYLLLLAALLSGKRWWVSVAGAIVVLMVSGYALADAYRVEPYVVEDDAIRLTERLQAMAQPDDAVIFQAFWQIGYFTTHYEGVAPSCYNMETLSMTDVETTLARHPRVWLAMFRVPMRTPEYPLEEWLDRNWHKGEEVSLGDTRLISYVRPSGRAWQSASFEFANPEGDQILRLAGVQLGTTEAKPRDMIAIGLRWQALRPITSRYTMFVQLVDSAGRSAAGTDSEPLGGSELTVGWPEGRAVEDRMALTVPAAVAPGDYLLVAGLHPTGSPQPLAVQGKDDSVSKQGAIIGHLRVDGYRLEDLKIQHHLDDRLGDSIVLLGYDLDIDSYQVGVTRTVTALTDNPIQVTVPKRSYRPTDTIGITLYWQSLHPIDQDYTVYAHLVDGGGRLWGQADSQPLAGSYPTTRWHADEVVVDEHHLTIDPNAPPGNYQIRVGMYLLATMQRLPVTTLLGPADEIALRQVKIDPP